MAVPVKKTNTMDKIKRVYKGFEFSIVESEKLASRAFCIFFGAKISAVLTANAKKQELAPLLPTTDLLAEILEITAYRKAGANGAFGNKMPMTTFFDNENPSTKLEYNVYQNIYSMVMFDLKSFFQDTSTE